MNCQLYTMCTDKT